MNKILSFFKTNIFLTWTITAKELKAYFVSPIAYSVLTVFTIISGVYFYIILSAFYTLFNQYRIYSQLYRDPTIMLQINLNERVISPLFQFLIIVLIFIVPAISMRLVAEERKSKTDELLLTSPLNSYNIILGKFIASLIFLVLTLATSAIYVVTLLHFGNPEIGPIISGYVGLLLVGALLLSIGLFASSLTINQINTYFISFAIGLLLLITGWAGQLTKGTKIGEILSYISITEHYKNMAIGLVTAIDLCYYLTIILCFIFLSKTALESSKWR